MKLKSYIYLTLLILIGQQVNAQSKIFIETGVDVLALTDDKKTLNLNIGYHQALKQGIGLSAAICIQRNQPFNTFRVETSIINEELYPYPQSWLVLFENGKLNNIGLKLGLTYSINRIQLEVGGGINKFTFSKVHSKLQVRENSAPQNEYVLDIDYSRELSSASFFSLHCKLSYLWTFGNISVGPYLDYIFNYYSENMTIEGVSGDLSPFTNDPVVIDYNQNANTYNPSAHGLLFGGLHLGYTF